METPILSRRPGGAIARPFQTHLSSLSPSDSNVAAPTDEITLSMRIAPELYLKQCIVAGFPRVYELGRVFRNEGVDPFHNPEFTMCEFYEAFSNATAMKSRVETLLSQLAAHVHGTALVGALDWYPPYAEIEVVPALERALNVKFDLSNETRLREQLESHTAPDALPRMFDRLIGEHLEPLCVHPTFLVNHPLLMSPLARPHPKDALLSDRFELFVKGGLEVANGYSEQNCPLQQRRQLASYNSSAESACTNEEYLEALQAGLPPTSGCGIGIDRVVMAITGVDNIRDVLLFPMTERS